MTVEHYLRVNGTGLTPCRENILTMISVKKIEHGKGKKSSQQKIVLSRKFIITLLTNNFPLILLEFFHFLLSRLFEWAGWSNL